MKEVLGEWKETFGKHGLKMSMENTMVMSGRQQRKEMNVRLEGKEIRYGNRFEYQGGAVMVSLRQRYEGGGCECMEEGGGSNGRQKDIKEIERECSDVVCKPAYLYGLETMALTETTTEAAGLREQLGQEACGS